MATEQDRQFAHVYARTGSVPDAAAAIGETALWGEVALRRPAVAVDIIRQQREAMCELLPAAVSRLAELLQSKSERTALGAAKLVLGLMLRPGAADHEREPHEMTAAELADAVAAARRNLAGLASQAALPPPAASCPAE